MPHPYLRLTALVSLVGIAAPSLAQEPDQAAARRQWEETFRRPKPIPAVPEPLRGVVDAPNSEWLVVRMNDGSRHSLGIGAITPGEFESFAGGRFVGFSYGGHEEFGYVLIDRAASGELAEIGTGAKPAFAEDGRHFAAAEVSGSGYGNLDGVAVWEVQPAGVRRLFYTDALPVGFNWRADAFRTPSCVVISAVEEGWEPTAPDRWEQEVRGAPRANYELRWSNEDGLYFGRSSDAACTGDGTASSR